MLFKRLGKSFNARVFRTDNIIQSVLQIANSANHVANISDEMNGL